MQYGAVTYIIGVVQFFIGIFVAASRYGPPSYDPMRDTISDLQAVKCGVFQGSEVCSPLHAVANTSVAVLGLALVFGSLLIRTAFPGRRGRRAAIGLLVAAGLAITANAFTPEDVTLTGDTLTALLAFLCADFGLVEVGGLVSGVPGWRNLGHLFEALGVAGLAALILDSAEPAGPLGAGGNEWLIVSPVVIWALAVGGILLGPKRLSGPDREEGIERSSSAATEARNWRTLAS